ncbi:MAG: hypothetical protein AAGG81_02095 [Chlamydiota bacterium]
MRKPLNVIKVILLLLIIQNVSFAAPLARHVIALYNSKTDKNSWYSSVLQYAAMPIEQQGLVVTYYDIQDGFPVLADDPNILGAVVWDLYLMTPEQAEQYLNWAIRSLEASKKLVFMGTVPGEYIQDQGAQLDKINKFWNLMGLAIDHSTQGDSFGAKYVSGPPFVTNFERAITGRMPTYRPITTDSEKVTVYVSAKSPLGGNYTLIASTPSGGYAATDFALYRAYFNKRDYIQWYINPFTFFKEAYQTGSYPKPDTTTLAGRRMYYSHIDGDGWNSVSLIDEYRENRDISAKVILDEVIAPNPQLTVTVSPIGADIDPDWVGLKQSQEVAKDLFSLNQVEVGSHTYSHPFDWGFFKDYEPRDEEPYLDKFPFKTWANNTVFDRVTEFFDKVDGEQNAHFEKEFYYPKKIGKEYEIPRAFANQKFDISQEVAGSAEYINQFSNPNKKVKVIQWSGNCLPFEKALELASIHNLKNINGGDTRFDAEFDSYGWVRPLGRNVGSWRQVFSSMSNENLYTDLWTDRFYGFNRLPHTFNHTETPIRLRPMNLYYHMYSGEKFASLKALKQNIEYIDNQEIIPIETSFFTDIVNGFHTTEIRSMGDDRWSFINRGALQTIRFDEAIFKVVDLSKSVGVIGQRHHQGSLYVALDEIVEEPLISLREQEKYYELAQADEPYLIESRWRIRNLNYLAEKKWSFEAKGYGEGEMSWYVPVDGEYTISVGGRVVDSVGANNHVLKFVLTDSETKSENGWQEFLMIYKGE